MQRESAEIGQKEWTELPLGAKIKSVLSQFLRPTKVQQDYDHFEKSFMLKTRRIEYTFNHFRVKEERADEL